MQALSEILFTIAFIILNFVYFSVNLFQDKTNSFLTPHSSFLTPHLFNYQLPTTHYFPFLFGHTDRQAWHA